DALHHAAPAEAQHHPVVTGAAAAPRFPTVAHAAGPPGHDQVQRLAEELIARGERRAAVLSRDEVDGAPRHRDPLPVGARLAPDAQPRHAAVRVDLEPHMRMAGVARDGELVLGVAGVGWAWQCISEPIFRCLASETLLPHTHTRLARTSAAPDP